MAPKDEDELVDMMFTATHEPHPVFIRYPRGPAEGVPLKISRSYLRSAKQKSSSTLRIMADEKSRSFRSAT